MSAECKKLRGPNDTGPDCGCRGDACALGRDAATTPRFVAIHDGDIASGVLDKRKGDILPFWIEQKKDGAKWAERLAAALNETGKEYR